MADQDKGGNPFEFVNTYFGPTLGWVKSQLLPTVFPPAQPVIGPGGGGGGSIAVGSTPITGGATGSLLYDNGGIVGESTIAQLTALLNIVTATLRGLAPPSGGGTANFLRADGSWAAPVTGASSIVVGSSTITSGNPGNYAYNNSGVYGEKSPTQLTADINVFTTALKGVAPPSGGGTSNFLRADGTWNAPPGGGGGTPGGTPGQIEYNNSGAFGGFTMSGDAAINTATGVLTINNGVVTYAKMQSLSATSRLHGSSQTTTPVQEITLGTNLSMSGTTLNAAAGVTSITVNTTGISGGATGNYAYNNAGIYSEHTPTQLTADVGVFTTALKGSVPASGGGTVNFLRADGAWAQALQPTATANLTAGYTFTAHNNGNLGSTFTPNPTVGNYQFGNCNVSTLTLNAPASDCSMDILITNTVAITSILYPAYTVANSGDSWPLNSGDKFILSIRRINGLSTFTIKALQ